MKRLVRRLVLLAGLAVFAGGGLFYRYLHQPIESKLLPIVLVVPQGASFTRLANDWHELGVIDRPLWWKFYARITGQANQIQAGEYRLDPGNTPLSLLRRLVAGDVVQYQLTLVEGWTFQRIRDYLAQQPRLIQQTLELDDPMVMAALGRRGEYPEGRFFPDSYRYTASMSDLDVLRQALEKMDQVLAQEWTQRDVGLPYESPYQALVMASIIERETALPDERAEIAGVFVRRLQQGMRLQTDPTVIYGMGAAYQGNISRKDLKADTVYNTYTRHGLPPTPIAMPGLEAIRAALHPAVGSSLYFVARGDGSHVFSDTLAQHQQAVQKYQINQRASGESANP